ncbi:hypothetical protein COO60DRAFT_1517288, partial [Scenedesmus sp. NREL 46B-D3]
MECRRMRLQLATHTCLLPLLDGCCCIWLPAQLPCSRTDGRRSADCEYLGVHSAMPPALQFWGDAAHCMETFGPAGGSTAPSSGVLCLCYLCPAAAHRVWGAVLIVQGVHCSLLCLTCKSAVLYFQLPHSYDKLSVLVRIWVWGWGCCGGLLGKSCQ